MSTEHPEHDCISRVAYLALRARADKLAQAIEDNLPNPSVVARETRILEALEDVPEDRTVSDCPELKAAADSMAFALEALLLGLVHPTPKRADAQAALDAYLASTEEPS